MIRRTLACFAVVGPLMVVGGAIGAVKLTEYAVRTATTEVVGAIITPMQIVSGLQHSHRVHIASRSK